jgi:peptidyl-prolyl cis-trans isomerase C
MNKSLHIVLAILAAVLIADASSSRAEDAVVVLVNGKPITEADLRMAANEFGSELSQVPTEHQLRLVTEYLVTSQLLADAAEAAGMGAGPEFEGRLVFAMRRLLRNLMIEKHAVEVVSEADVKRVYDEQVAKLAAEEEIRIRQMLVASEAIARDVRAKIASGVDFATLAKALSEDTPTAWRGGDLGWRVKSELDDKIAAAAFALRNPGDLSDPVHTEHGWHVIQLEERRQRPIPEFAAVKDRIRSQLVREKSEVLANNLREKASVVYLDPKLQLEGAPRAQAQDTVDGPPTTVVATAPTVTTAPASTTASLWSHKGARMRLAAIGDSVRIEFEAPSEALAKQGIEPGSPIFKGKRAGLSYTGEAFAYSPQCGSRPFPVEGEASADERRLELRGKAPNMDAGCNVTGTRDEVLVFRTLGG